MSNGKIGKAEETQIKMGAKMFLKICFTIMEASLNFLSYMHLRAKQDFREQLAQ